MKYSKRVTAISNIINKCSCLLDVGCDHGYVCIISCENGTAQKAIASDINKGPLQKAFLNIEKAGLSDRISTVLSDGLQEINTFFDALCICGMGGLLIKDILIEGKNKLSDVNQLILGPHSELFSLRKYLTEETEFVILNETAVYDEGKYYSIFDVRNKNTVVSVPEFNEEFLLFGNPFIQKDLSTYKDMLTFELTKRNKALNDIALSFGEKAMDRKKELESETIILNNILNLIEN